MAQGILSNYEPSWREQTSNFLMGDSRPSATRRNFVQGLLGGPGIMGLVDFVPGVGQALALNDAYRNGGAQDMALAGMPIPGARLAKPIVKEAKAGIRAFHGSPHDFDKFSMDKIGTGEGAQVYGRGLYFAEAEDTARSYREALSGRLDPNAAGYINKAGGDKVKAIAAMEADLSGRAPSKHIAALREEIVNADAPRGHMYEVNIKASPDEFLDWDAPVFEQPKVVAALKERGMWRDWMAKDSNYTGQELARQLSGDMGSAPGNITESLPGFSGIKYKDQFSRGKEGGTRNYVAMRDDIIEVVRKYGIAGAATLLGLSQADVSQAMEAK